MKKLCIEIQNSKRVIFYKEIDFEPLKENSWVFIKMLIRLILASVKGNGKLIVIAVRKCLFEMVRSIRCKDKKNNIQDITYVSAKQGQIKIIARLTDGTESSKEGE